MPRRNIRATFLLKCANLAASVLLFALTYQIFKFSGFTLFTIIALVIFWFIGIELEFLPDFLAQVAEKAHRISHTNTSSIWFVDINAQDAEEREKFNKSTEDNPTIR